MDEIMVSNFMVFSDLVASEHYDLWVGDEAWDVDYFLHENPELKRAPYAWLTDFVGWLPMPDGGDREAALTADYNAEMIEQIGRFPGLRDRAVFVGNPGDVVAGQLRRRGCRRSGTGSSSTTSSPATSPATIPLIPPTGPRSAPSLATGPMRRSAWSRSAARVSVPSLLRRVVAAYPAAKQLVPALRMIVVAGPRIDPATLPSHDGLELHGYVHDLYRHLAVCDLAVVQGGLTTTMELTAARAALHLRAAAAPLRAELPRPAPARQIPRGPLPGLRGHRAGLAGAGHSRGSGPSASATAGGNRWRRAGRRLPRRSSSDQARCARLAQDVRQAHGRWPGGAALQRRPRLR